MYETSGYYPQKRMTNQDQLLADLKKAVDGEYSAIHCYQRIIQMAPSQEVRERVMEIRKDEIRHFQNFVQLYYSLTGTEVTPQITETCPNNYVQALEFAIKDEQNTVDFYNEVAAYTQIEGIKATFSRAAKDEQNHAVWFLYYFTKSFNAY